MLYTVLSILLFFPTSLLAIETLEVLGQRVRSHEHGHQMDLSAREMSLAESLQQLPSISSVGGSNRPRFFQIRGLGDRGQFSHTQMSQVGVFYEGIDLSEEASVLPLFQNDRLDLIYGPDTIRWGSKAMAGSMSVESCIDISCPSNSGRLMLSEFKTYGLRTRQIFDVDESRLAIGGGFHRSDTPYFNVYLNEATNQQDEKDLVLAGKHQRAGVTIGHHHLLALHDNGYDVWRQTGGREMLSDEPGRDRLRVMGHSINIQTDKMSWMSSLTQTKQLESYDEDWGNNQFWQTVPGWNQDYQYFSEFNRRRMKQHHKATHSLSSNFTMGVHYQIFEETVNWRSFKEGALRRVSDNELNDQQYSAVLSFSKEWGAYEVEIDGRVGRQEKALISDHSTVLKDRDQLWSYRVYTQRSLTRHWRASAKVQQGVRGGGYNTDRSVPIENISYKTESLFHTEFSAQYQVRQALLKLNSFFYRYRNQHIRSTAQFDPEDPSTFTTYTSNLGRSNMSGLELSGQLSFGDYVLQGSAAYFYKRELPYVPLYSGTMSLNYQRERFSAYFRAKAQGSYRFSNDHEYRSDAYPLFDLGVEYQLKDILVHIMVLNVTNQSYPVRAFAFANRPPDWNEEVYYQLGSPRTLGVSLSWSF
jgi:iron complex outermembrane recepter protein